MVAEKMDCMEEGIKKAYVERLEEVKYVQVLSPWLFNE
jgi:hypothetical protein